MAARHEIREFSLVGLTEAVDAEPVGAQGGVVDLIDSDTAIVEVMKPDLDGLDRIVFAAPSQLRVL